MKEMIVTLSRRLGAGAAAFLVAKLGIPDATAQQIVIAGGVFLGLGIDALVASFMMRNTK